MLGRPPSRTFIYKVKAAAVMAMAPIGPTFFVFAPLLQKETGNTNPRKKWPTTERDTAASNNNNNSDDAFRRPGRKSSMLIFSLPAVSGLFYETNNQTTSSQRKFAAGISKPSAYWFLNMRRRCRRLKLLASIHRIHTLPHTLPPLHASNKES